MKMYILKMALYEIRNLSMCEVRQRFVKGRLKMNVLVTPW